MLTGQVAMAAGKPRRSRSLHVTWHQTSAMSSQADPYVFAPGEQLDVGFSILSPVGPNDQIGTAGLHCSVTGGGGTELLCQAGFTLPGGKIMAQSLFDVATEAFATVRNLAITGGTGIYRGVGGELTVTTINDTDEDGLFEFDR